MIRNRSNPLATIRRFSAPGAAAETCELCSAPLAEEHDHLVEAKTRKLLCACTPCAILFGHRGDAKFARVRRLIQNLESIRLPNLLWESLGLPVSLAFLFHSTAAGRAIAVYPSPAGPTEAPVPTDSWRQLLTENPELAGMQSHVEALLVNRAGGARHHFRVSIDHCYRLVGLLRQHWRGFNGGDRVWQEIGAFFDKLASQAEKPCPT